jgi:hypothetical protein
MTTKSFQKNSKSGLIKFADNNVIQTLTYFTYLVGGLALLGITIKALNYAIGNIVQLKNTLKS